MRDKVIRRIYWRLLRLIGLKKISWDKQHKAGLWNFGQKSPDTIELVANYCKGGKIVELGCGEGLLPFYLPENSFSEYVGYDISEAAVEQAKQRAKKEKAANVNYKQCDIAKWDDGNGISLILFEESLYYLPIPDMENLLKRCSAALNKDGSILVIVHSAEKHSKTLNVCRNCCSVVNELVIDSRTYLVLAPKGQ